MYKKFQLKNGLNVLLVESHKSPVVSVQMWVKTGSADEGKGEEGISHFIEHLVFKGTRSFGVGEIASTIEGSGGQLNAYTSFDQTVFYVTISKEFSEVGLKAISEMMGHPTFDSEEIDNEREVVIEEIKRGNDNPHRQASRALFETVYKKHPYSLPVIGYAKNIEKVSKKTLVEYFRRRYVPENMTLLIVGDFEKKEMKALVEQHFSDFEKLKLKKVKRKLEPKQEKPRHKVHGSSFNECLFYLAWPIPKVTHKDIPALDVLAMILGQGESSRLTHSLKNKSGLVNYVGSFAFTPQDKGFFSVSGSTSVDRLEDVLDKTGDEILDFLALGPEPEELNKALINFNSEEYYSMQTVDGLAGKYGSYEHLFGDFKYHKKYLKQINDLDLAEIRRVAKKYLKPETMSVVVMAPEDKETAEKHVKTFKRKFKKEIGGLKAKKIEVGTRKKRIQWSPKATYAGKSSKTIVAVLKGGARVYLRPESSSNVISLKSAFNGGVRVEPDNKLGLTELFSKNFARSTKSLTEKELVEKVDGLASSISAFGGRNTVGLSVSTLSPFLPEMLHLHGEMLTVPKFDGAILEREKARMLESLKMREDNPAQISILNFMEKMFGKHPYAKDMAGTESSIASINIDDLEGVFKNTMNSNNMHVSVAGNFEIEEMKAHLEELSLKMSKGSEIKNQFPFLRPQSNEQIFTESDKEQSHIVYGFPGLTFTSEDRFALQVMQSILAGQGGRLFIELRDKESLAYSVSPLRMEGIDAGYFGAYIGCSPEKGKKAIEMMEVEFKKLCNKKVGDKELERAKRFLIGRHDIDLQKVSSISSSILFDAIYGLDPDETYHYASRIGTIDSEQVMRVAQKIFGQSHVISVVGPHNPWN